MYPYHKNRYTPIGSGRACLCGKDAQMFNYGKYDAQNRYDEWNTTQIKLKLNNKTDKDILEWVKEQKYGRDSSIQGAIKALIREDIRIKGQK